MLDSDTIPYDKDTKEKKDNRFVQTRDNIKNEEQENKVKVLVLLYQIREFHTN